MPQSNGLGLGLHNISRLSHAQTRSISAENPTGEKGRGGMATDGPFARASRDLGQGWKVSHTHQPNAARAGSRSNWEVLGLVLRRLRRQPTPKQR